MTELIHHPLSFATALLIAYFVFMSAVGAMPDPLPGQERGLYAYTWRFLQRLAANAHRFAAQRVGADLAGPDGSVQLHAAADDARKRRLHRLARIADVVLALVAAIGATSSGSYVWALVLLLIGLIYSLTILD
jgi:hypothetical protein